MPCQLYLPDAPDCILPESYPQATDWIPACATCSGLVLGSSPNWKQSHTSAASSVLFRHQLQLVGPGSVDCVAIDDHHSGNGRWNLAVAYTVLTVVIAELRTLKVSLSA